jgi:uncharacterized Zn finger protein (UPF0148 family)
MSDFDKEAEREKLRKQFEEDEAKRESTERMSELLLQGATMTNRHCDTCGDPIFRYDGREFCPTCQVEITDEEEEGETQAAAEQQQQPEQQPQQPAQSQPSANDASPSESDATNIEIGTGNSEAADVERESTTESEPTTEPEPAPASVSEPEPEPKSEPTSKSPVRSASSHGTTDLSEARQSLSRTITRFAKQAEAADDLAYARECLAATEDAAEALEAVERVEMR